MHAIQKACLHGEHGFNREGVVSRLPLPMLISLWLFVSQGVFLFPWVGPVGLVFSQPLGLQSFCFLPARSGWGWLSPSLFGLWWLCLFVFLSFWHDCFISRCLLWGSGRANMSSTRFFGRIFLLFALILEARSTLIRRLLINTHPLATFPVVFLPCCRKL